MESLNYPFIKIHLRAFFCREKLYVTPTARRWTLRIKGKTVKRVTQIHRFSLKQHQLSVTAAVFLWRDTTSHTFLILFHFLIFLFYSRSKSRITYGHRFAKQNFTDESSIVGSSIHKSSTYSFNLTPAKLFLAAWWYSVLLYWCKVCRQTYKLQIMSLIGRQRQISAFLVFVWNHRDTRILYPHRPQDIQCQFHTRIKIIKPLSSLGYWGYLLVQTVKWRVLSFLVQYLTT